MGIGQFFWGARLMRILGRQESSVSIKAGSLALHFSAI